MIESICHRQSQIIENREKNLKKNYGRLICGGGGGGTASLKKKRFLISKKPNWRRQVHMTRVSASKEVFIAFSWKTAYALMNQLGPSLSWVGSTRSHKTTHEFLRFYSFCHRIILSCEVAVDRRSKRRKVRKILDSWNPNKTGSNILTSRANKDSWVLIIRTHTVIQYPQ